MRTIAQPEAPPETETDDRPLLWTAALFAMAVLVHNIDHARRGVDAVGRDVFWAGTSAIALEVFVVAVVFQRHRWAPLVAAGAGSSLAVGYLVVHFLPRRSWLSDSFVSGGDVDALSWFAASFEAGAAVAIAVAGAVVLRRRGGLVSAMRPHAAQRGVGKGIMHPVVLAVLLGNVIILAVSAIQLGST